MPAAGPVPAQDVALAVIDFCNEHGEWLTNLRLQKVLYYCQGWHLGYYGVPLFPERLEAWVHGPACPPVVEQYSRFEHRPIDVTVPAGSVPPALAEHVADIWEAYGSLSTYDLERYACRETPWLNARGGLSRSDPSHAALSVDDMREFFAAEAARDAANRAEAAGNVAQQAVA